MMKVIVRDFQYDTFFLHPMPSSRFHFHIPPHDHVVTLYSSPIISHCFGSYCLLPLFSSLVLPCSSFHCTFTTSFSRAVIDSIYTHHLQWLSFEFFSLDPHLQVCSMPLMYVHSTDYRLFGSPPVVVLSVVLMLPGVALTAEKLLP